MKRITPAILIVFLILQLLPLEGQIKDGLVANYTFNNAEAKDDCGKHPPKAYGIAFVEDRFGNAASACYFDGGSYHHLNLGTDPALKPKTGSISLWVNIHGINGRGRGVESNPVIYTRAHADLDCNEAFYIGFDLNTRKINGGTLLDCPMVTSIFSKKPVALVSWHHVVITYNDNFTCLYLNGVLEEKKPKEFKSRFLAGDSVLVGMRYDKKNQRYLLGCVDDIELYNRVLTPEEVLTLYNAPNPNESKVILNRIGIAAMVAGFILLIVLIIRRWIHSLVNKEKAKNQLRNNWYEQENRVLTAQMDPHFIFNSLNTIQQFIITNDNDKAQLYLSKFSRLIRQILENNMKNSVTLKTEIEIFRKYLEIELLRFNTVFNYSIVVAEDIDYEKTNIPRFLIQPVIENAIWHGLLPKEGKKQLTVSFEKLNEKTISCTVDDNGVGRRNTKPLKEFEKRKSMAVNFIRQRLQLFSKMKNTEYGIKIIDKLTLDGESDGTRVIITIPILEN